MARHVNLLLFNLKVDADDDVLGFTTDWINALATHCEKIFVITMSAGRLAVAENVLVMSVGRELGYTEVRRAGRFYRLLLSLLRTQRVDACFAHMMPLFALMGWPLLSRRHIPIVLWYAHGSVSPTLRLATHVVDRIVTSSPTGLQLQTSKLRIVGQGIDTARFRAVPRHRRNQDFTLLTVGRISAVKNVHLLIHAVALLRASHPAHQVKARLVGSPLTDADRHYTASLEEEIDRLGLTEDVVMAPGQPFHRIDREYHDADCFVNSSDTDSADKTVLEAMSCELPVVTSNLAFQDILGSELSARWVIPKRDVHALYDRIAILLEMSPDQRAELGRALRHIVVRDHSLPALSRRIMEQVREVRHEQV